MTDMRQLDGVVSIVLQFQIEETAANVIERLVACGSEKVTGIA